jgi:uncharacterized membrane protein YccC
VLITRRDLRMAFTAGLGNGFSYLSGIPFGYYVPLAVFATAGGTYGASLELGRQRILGTILGGALLYVSFWGLQGIPLALAIAITLGALRLLGGLLKLKVGYKVGGLIVVMGWLIHGGDIPIWITIRLFWTAFGVILTVLALQLFWPMRSGVEVFKHYANLLVGIQAGLQENMRQIEGGAVNRRSAQLMHQQLRNQLISLRNELPGVAQELGENPMRHPRFLLINDLIGCSSRLIIAINGLLRYPSVRPDLESLRTIHQAESALLNAVCERLGLWQRLLLTVETQGHRLPPAPAEPFQAPERWNRCCQTLQQTDTGNLSFQQLERMATRINRCRQILRTMEETERQWSHWHAA